MMRSVALARPTGAVLAIGRFATSTLLLAPPRKGARASGGRACAWKVKHAERCTRVGTEVGIRTSVASQLVVVLEMSKISVWKLAPRFGDLRQGQSVSRGIYARGTDLSVLQHFLCAMPTWLATLFPAVQALSNLQFMHIGHRTLRVRAKGGWAHVRAAGGAAHRGLRSTGGRPGSLGRCPLAELGQDPVSCRWRPSRPLLRA